MASPKLRVAVIGGGLAGLTLAISLSKSADLSVDLYEAAHKFGEIGAGIVVWKRPYQVLKALGLRDVLAAMTEVHGEEEQVLGYVLRKADRGEGVTISEINMPFGGLNFQRYELQETLVKYLTDHTSARFHFNKRLTSYTQPLASSADSATPIRLQFEDGSSTTCDVLLGTDGIHSVTRMQLLRELAAVEEDAAKKEVLLGDLDPVWSGWVAYRGIIPAEKLEAVWKGHRAARMDMNYMGKNRHIIAFPMAHDKLVNVVAFCYSPGKEGTVHLGKSVENRPKAELLEQYAGWEPEVLAMLNLIDTPSRWVINNLKGLPNAACGRVAILGDAAHAMTPHQGSGAGQAIEDAHVMSALLTHPLTTPATLPTALRVYEQVRLPHANGVMQRSRENGLMYEFNDPRFAALAESEDPAALQAVATQIERNWEWAWTTSVEDDVRHAVEMLEKALAS